MMSGEECDSCSDRNADDSDPTAQDSGSNNVAKKSNQGLATKMFSYANSFFFAGIIFTILVALQSSPPKISKPPPARPFFNQSSVVVDFYDGALTAMVERIMDSDFSFIMYYAPWDAESQALKAEFEIVAQYYHSQIFFSAINCWNPGSECRAQYNKIQSYPVLMLYPSRHSGVQYKGIRTAPYMIQFIDAVMNPIVRISSRMQLVNLLLENDAVVVGFFNFTGVSKGPGYKEFYQSAIHSLERDPNKEVIYAAITDPKIAELNYSVVTFPYARLFMWNESLSYPENDDWKTENLLDWVSKNMHRVTLWLQPPGSKSLTFAPYLWDGPVLFLFTPRNPLHLENYNYNVMKELALQYYDCGENFLVNELVRGLKEKRLQAVMRNQNKIKECTQILSKRKTQSIFPTVSFSIEQWINDTCCAQIVMNKCLQCKKKVNNDHTDASVCSISLNEFNQVCLEKDVFKIPSSLKYRSDFESCCSKNGEKKTNKADKKIQSVGLDESDPFSASVIQQLFHKEECRKFLIGNTYYPTIFPKDNIREPSTNFTSSICEVNKTLSFIAIDSLYYFHFAEALGVDVSNHKDKTAVVILDPTEESQYVLKEDFSLSAVTQFINNYHEGFLQRTLRSDKARKFVHSFKKAKECKMIGNSSVCVPELTTDTFLQTVLNPIKDVVVMYHSPYCAFCSVIAYVYLTIAHYLSKMNHLVFVRVDGDNNDLPWEYSMDRYPSVLFFPARRKEDSTVFPFSLPITVSNLLNFVLANLEGDSHIEALVNICHIGAGEPPNDCVIRIRWLCLDVIENLLQEHRKLRRHESFLGKRMSSDKRRVILLKLKHIRSVHLILETTNDLAKDEPKVNLIRQMFKFYYRTLSSLSGNIKRVSKTKSSVSSKSTLLKDEL